jgi:hypothetical protein
MAAQLPFPQLNLIGKGRLTERGSLKMPPLSLLSISRIWFGIVVVSAAPLSLLEESLGRTHSEEAVVLRFQFKFIP